MLNQFENHLIARRRSANTIRLRMVYMRQLAERHDLTTVTTSDLENFIVAHPQWSGETINSVISTFSVFYKWAVRNKLIETDPTYYLERARVQRGVRALADDEKIRVALETATPRDRAILLLGREAGLRRIEIATLHRRDRQGDWLNIVGKGNRLRRLHITPRLREALAALENDGYYFPGRDIPHMAGSTVHKVSMRYLGTSPHAMRRSAITAVYYNSGGDIRMAQEFAGHASPNTTAVYIQVNDRNLIQAGEYAALAA